ncbi:phenylacetaldoxime dehydratase [Spongiactinospora rosea]|uniref:Phenylacetaldoxime dehydratase n=1 Tax=Spongiactinospora rosea TaxID=2248750 RepID=A0A366LXG7_9ACTN|nr:phenylacetaldoxime dehydratase family protein [Spongiactinospora rosea]RBQ18004.1 phenylacetaldoxime dehydratase [Spongiactinospora rosea]
MENTYHITYERSIPERRPDGFQPKNARWSLRWRRPTPTLIAEWLGVQGVEPGGAAARDFLTALRTSMDVPDGPEAWEVFFCPQDETGRPAVVAVAYWTSATAHAAWSCGSRWAGWWHSPARLEDGVGYWRETIVCPYERHETIYSQPHYRIGLGRTRESETVEITTNGYFGAMRDRIPLSAIDPLESPLGVEVVQGPPLDPRGRRIIVHSPLNTSVIRSGQFWHDSEPEQAADYEDALRPKLDRGMDHLEEHASTGTIFLRRLTNLDEHGEPRRETSIYAVLQDIAGLEEWAARHATHKAIYKHQIAKGLEYGPRRDVITWHEVFVLPENNRFEYVNCAPGTGLTRIGPWTTPAA